MRSDEYPPNCLAYGWYKYAFPIQGPSRWEGKLPHFPPLVEVGTHDNLRVGTPTKVVYRVRVELSTMNDAAFLKIEER